MPGVLHHPSIMHGCVCVCVCLLILSTDLSEPRDEPFCAAHRKFGWQQVQSVGCTAHHQHVRSLEEAITATRDACVKRCLNMWQIYLPLRCATLILGAVFFRSILVLVLFWGTFLWGSYYRSHGVTCSSMMQRTCQLDARWLNCACNRACGLLLCCCAAKRDGQRRGSKWMRATPCN